MLNGDVEIADFPSTGETTRLRWQQSVQGFVLVPGPTPEEPEEPSVPTPEELESTHIPQAHFVYPAVPRPRSRPSLPDGVFVSAGGYEAEQKLRKVHFPAHPSTPEALAADLSADRAELEEKTDGC